MKMENLLERPKKVISIAVLISLVLCSCGSDGANLARRDDNNIAGGAVEVNKGANAIAGGVKVVNQGAIAASTVKQGNEWLGADSGQVTNANENTMADYRHK